MELTDLAHANLNSMSNRDAAAFWSALPRLLHQRGGRTDPELESKLRSLTATTCERIESFQYCYLAQTSLGVAKTITKVKRGNRRHRGDDPRRILRDLLVDESQDMPIFQAITNSTVPMLNRFDARCLSNIIYSYGLIRHNPKIGEETLFDVFGQAAAKKLHTFNSQDISNMLLAFVYVDEKNDSLFDEACRTILEMDLDSFTEQHFANLLWSLAKSDQSDPDLRVFDLFQVLGDRIVERRLDKFWPQHLSNIVWAFATARVSHTVLFKKIGDHITELDSLHSFKPQELSITAWAFATAGVHHSEMFDKIRDHVVSLDSLGSFEPMALANTARAYAIAGRYNLGLFERLATEAASKKDRFDDEEAANFISACAKVGYTDERLSGLDKIGLMS